MQHSDVVTSLFGLAGKSALVSGANGALGETAVMALAQAGASMTLADTAGAKLDALASKVKATGAKVTTVAAWPDSEAGARKMVDAAVAAHGGLDIMLIANGLNEVDPIVDMSLERWERVMDVHVKSAWLLCRAAGAQMLKQGRGGKIVMISSTRGKLGHPAGYTAYCTAKSAIDGLTRTLACEWGPHQITVNAIGPTVFRSPLSAWMYAEEGKGKAVREEMLKRIPIGRLGEPSDLVGGILFLTSPASNFCTGQVLYLDGGYTAG
jgi:NAD(P)-dependent dehydrogenase (short-subunit alcohol dehydrogenase family)